MSTFGQINLLISDMAASMRSYRLLELDFADPFEWPPGSDAEHIGDIHATDGYMALDNPAMARIWNRQFEPERSRGNVVIGFMVDNRADVDRLYETVTAAGHLVGQEPNDAIFGSRYAIVIDPDGNQVGRKSPIEDARRFEPDC